VSFAKLPRMSFVELQAPPGYQALCEQLQVENDPARFRILVDLVNRLLTFHEKDIAGEEGCPE
jgi:hypothetical protein